MPVYRCVDSTALQACCQSALACASSAPSNAHCGERTPDRAFPCTQMLGAAYAPLYPPPPSLPTPLHRLEAERRSVRMARTWAAPAAWCPARPRTARLLWRPQHPGWGPARPTPARDEERRPRLPGCAFGGRVGGAMPGACGRVHGMLLSKTGCPAAALGGTAWWWWAVGACVLHVHTHETCSDVSLWRLPTPYKT